MSSFDGRRADTACLHDCFMLVGTPELRHLAGSIVALSRTAHDLFTAVADALAAISRLARGAWTSRAYRCSTCLAQPDGACSQTSSGLRVVIISADR
jgi:hypothetical protein